MQSNLELLLAAVGSQLQTFALSDQFWPLWERYFGSRYDQALAHELRQQWQRGDFSQLPEVVVVKDEGLDTDKVGYVSGTSTIYIRETQSSHQVTDQQHRYAQTQGRDVL